MGRNIRNKGSGVDSPKAEHQHRNLEVKADTEGRRCWSSEARNLGTRNEPVNSPDKARVWNPNEPER